jgi:hypothetical protein
VARQSFGDREPLGRSSSSANMDGDTRPLTVVGVVGDVRENGLAADPEPTDYSLARQRPPSTGLVAAGRRPGPRRDDDQRPGGAPRGARPRPRLLPVTARPIEEVFARALADRRYALLLAGAFGRRRSRSPRPGCTGVVAYVAGAAAAELGGARGARRARADVRARARPRARAGRRSGSRRAGAAPSRPGRLLAAQLYG